MLGCQNTVSTESKILNNSLALSYKKLSIGQTEEIKLSNFYSSNLKIITPPYVSKDEFIPLIKDAKLSEELAWTSAKIENCHLFIIDNNRLVVDITLPGYVDVNARILFSKNQDIVLKVKKIERDSRPLIIENLR